MTKFRISPTFRVTLARRCSTTFRSVPVTSLAPLGIVRVWTASDAVRYGAPGGDDKLAIKLRADAHAPGAGFHVALSVPDRAAVDAFHREALAHGGTDDGAPGLRPQYGGGYYAAFVVDPDGHRVEAVVHER